MAEQVKIVISADPAPGIKGVKKFQTESKKQFNKFEGNAKKSSNKVLGQFKKLGLGISAALLARAAVRGFDTIIKKIDQIGKLSIRLGETTDFLSEMGFVAARSGVSWQSLSVGIQRANRRIAEAKIGMGEAIKPLAELGLLTDVQNGKYKTFEDILPILSDRIRALTSDQDKLRIAFKLFDTEGVSFLQFLKEGSAGIADLRERGKEFGATITKDMAEKAADAADKITNMNTALEALGRDFALDAADGVGKLATKLSDLLKELRKIKKEGGKDLFTFLGTTFFINPNAPRGGIQQRPSGTKRPNDPENKRQAEVRRIIAGGGKRVQPLAPGAIDPTTPTVIVKLTDDAIAEKLLLQQTAILSQLTKAGVFQTNLLPGTSINDTKAQKAARDRVNESARRFDRIDGLTSRNQFTQDRGADLIDDTVEATRGWEVALTGVEGILQQIVLDFENIDSFTKSFGKQIFSQAISLAFRALAAKATGGGSEVVGAALGKAGPGNTPQISISTTKDIDIDYFTRVIVPLNNQFVRNGGTLRASTTSRT